MARKPRIEFSGALYHVYSRGNQKQDIFLDGQDFKVFVSRLLEYKEEHGFLLYAYTLMKNHFHLLIKTGETGLSKIMQGLLQSYTQYFNLKHKKVGHVFQGRYKAVLCQEDTYFLALVRYIHLNCVRAGCVKHPDDYEWCSHGAYVNGGSALVDVDAALENFSEDKSAAVKKYRVFINDALKPGADLGRSDDICTIIDQTFLGNERFIKEVSKKAGDGGDISETGLGEAKVGMNDILDVVEKRTGVKRADMLGKPRDEATVKARAVFISLAKQFSGKTGRELAQKIDRDPSMVTVLAKLGAGRFKKDVESCAKDLNSIFKPDPK